MFKELLRSQVRTRQPLSSQLHKLLLYSRDAFPTDLFYFASFARSSAMIEMAFNAATVTVLPPFLPTFVINGIPSKIANSALDSAAETNPTGIPIIKSGFARPSLIQANQFK